MRHDSVELDPARSGGKSRRRRWRPIGLIAGAAIAAAGLLFSGIAASSPTPKHGDSIPNVTLVENQIKAYYDDTVVGADHVPSPDGNYAHEVEGIAGQGQQYLASHRNTHGQGAAAVVFDVDDTTLNTYNYEIFSTFAFNPVTNADFVNTERFPAVFGMPDLVNWANSNGYTVFFLTGRPEAQRPGTEGNLAKVGYVAPADATHLYMRNRTSPPTYLPCEPTCTTIQYKSLTRGHIESLGFHIVANFGDQFSDLEGGFADRTFKLPNPMYFLP